MKKLLSTRAVIDAFGGNKKFADAMRDGTTQQAVNNWGKPKAKFPANRYITINIICDVAKVFVVDSMFAMRRRR